MPQFNFDESETLRIRRALEVTAETYRVRSQSIRAGNDLELDAVANRLEAEVIAFEALRRKIGGAR